MDQLLVDLEMVVVDNHLIAHLAIAALAHLHFVLRHARRELHLCLVHLEQVVLEVDLVVPHLMPTHPVEIETKRRPRHSP